MYRHCRKQHNRFSFRLTILGKYVDACESYDDEQLAGAAADLAKFHLRTQFAIELPASLDGEVFSLIAYSKLGINLADSSAVASALAPGVSAFISEHRSELEKLADSAPEEPEHSKIRRSEAFLRQPEIRAWVVACERADLDAHAFKEIDHDSFFLRLRVVQKSFETALKSAQLAQRMHSGVTNEKLVARRTELETLIAHLSETQKYVEEFSARLKSESVAVFTALQTLESARPSLT